MRLGMLADNLIALPDEIFNKIMGILGVNEAAVRIQRFMRGLDTRLRIPAGGLFGGTPLAPRPTRRAKYAWEDYGGRYRMLIRKDGTIFGR